MLLAGDRRGPCGWRNPSRLVAVKPDCPVIARTALRVPFGGSRQARIVRESQLFGQSTPPLGHPRQFPGHPQRRDRHMQGRTDEGGDVADSGHVVVMAREKAKFRLEDLADTREIALDTLFACTVIRVHSYQPTVGIRRHFDVANILYLLEAD